MTLLEFKNLSFTYPCSQQATLTNFSLDIELGQKIAIIGHNGCGKTTLLHLANGLYQPQQGQIYLDSLQLKYDRKSLNQWRQKIGLVFQNPEQQLVATTVEEDLSYGLCNLGLPIPQIASRVKQALIDFDFADLANFPVNYLSLGQKKRLAIADVMILEPEILLLDEPTAFLDPKQVKDLHQQLSQIQQRGTTVILTSHNLDFVYQWADWIYVISQGELVLQGTPPDVFTQEELLVKVQLGIPTAIEIMKNLKTIENR